VPWTPNWVNDGPAARTKKFVSSRRHDQSTTATPAQFQTLARVDKLVSREYEDRIDVYTSTRRHTARRIRALTLAV